MRVLSSSAGSAALAVTLGLESAEQYGHGAEFERESVLGPVLGAFSCVLTVSDHMRAAANQTDVTGQQKHTHVAHQLAKLAARLKGIRGEATMMTRQGVVTQYNNFLKLVTKNRQCLVHAVAQSLMKV